jgi:hypothetical protein
LGRHTRGFAVSHCSGLLDSLEQAGKPATWEQVVYKRQSVALSLQSCAVENADTLEKSCKVFHFGYQSFATRNKE